MAKCSLESLNCSELSMFFGCHFYIKFHNAKKKQNHQFTQFVIGSVDCFCLVLFNVLLWNSAASPENWSFLPIESIHFHWIFVFFSGGCLQLDPFF